MAFTVIGTFADDDAANQAAAQLDTLVKRIAQWHVNHPFKSEKLFKGGQMRKLSPPEQEAATEYGVTWRPVHGWLALPDMEAVDGIVSVLDHYVLLTGGADADEAAPFDTIMDKLNAQTVMVDDAAGAVHVSLMATAPDAQTAQVLAHDLQVFVESAAYAPMPWAVYAGGERMDEAETLQQIEPVYLNYLTVIEKLEAAQESGDSAGIQAQQEALDALPELDDDLVDLLDEVREATAFYDASLQVDDRMVAVKDAAFEEIASGLPALRGWLRAAGCVLEPPEIVPDTNAC